MKVCLVTPYDLSVEGGVNKHIFALARNLRRLGDEVDVLGPQSGGAPAEPSVVGFGGVVSIQGNGSDNRLGLLASPFRVHKYVRRRSFDVVHVHEPLLPALGYYAAWSCDASVARIATFHCYSEKESVTCRWARLAMSSHLRCFHRGIAVSAPAARYAKVAWSRDLSIIANGVDADFFNPPASSPDRALGEPMRLLFVGQWTDERKGLHVLLRAYALLRAIGARITLDVVGQGDARMPTLEPVEGVTFRGRVSEAELRRYFHECDVFVAPSTGKESFGMVLTEAMASARPIVCSNIEGYRQVVDERGAVFFSAGDARQLARAIAQLCGDVARREQMSRHNLGAVRSFEWASLASRVRAEYKLALSVSRSSRVDDPRVEANLGNRPVAARDDGVEPSEAA